MKITNPFLSKKFFVKPRGWLPEEKVKFKEIIPLKLKNAVSGKSEKSVQTACIQEMMVMFSCLKKNDFAQSPCSKEIELMNKCYTNHGLNQKKEKEAVRLGLLIPGSKDLNHRQINILLSKFPSKY